MKKIFMFAFAAVAITFASCGNKTNANQEAADSAAVAVEASKTEAQNVIEQLKEKIASKDASAIQDILTKVQEYVKANPETAKEYLTKVQEFVKENAESIKAAVGDNAVVNTIVTTLTTTSPEEVVNKFVGDAAQVGADAKELVDGAKTAVENAPEAAKEAANKAVEDTKAKVNEKANEQVNKGKEAANKAIDKGVSDVKNKLGL